MKAYYIDGNTMHLDQTKPNKKGAKMHTIYDHKLFQELVENPCWETLFDADFNPKNPNIPVLAGGLDHISKTKKYFVFHDIGCNGRDNSFRIGDANPIGETK